MIANALAASLVGFVQGVKIEDIRAALRSFKASAKQIPGRMNLFNLGRCHALVDYAHNPAGYEAVGSFVKNWPGPSMGVVGGPGDRRDEDFVALGKLSAEIFDHIVIKEDDDTRGRPRGEAAELIMQGIAQAAADTPDADAPAPVVHLDEASAIEWALDNAPDQGLVVVLPDSVTRAIALINARGPIPDSLDSLEGAYKLNSNGSLPSGPIPMASANVGTETPAPNVAATSS